MNNQNSNCCDAILKDGICTDCGHGAISWEEEDKEKAFDKLTGKDEWQKPLDNLTIVKK